MEIHTAAYQVFYNQFTDAFIRKFHERRNIQKTAIYSCTRAEFQGAVFEGKKIVNEKYFYRRHSDYNLERVFIGEINNEAFWYGLKYIGIETNEKNFSFPSLNKMYIVFLERYKKDILKNIDASKRIFLQEANDLSKSLGESESIIIEKSADIQNNSQVHFLKENELLYLLPHFALLELFCHIKLKYDLELGQYHTFKDLNLSKKSPSKSEIKQYLFECNENYSTKFTRDTGIIDSQLLYKIRIAIEQSTPFLFFSEDLFKIISYLGFTSNEYESYKIQQTSEKLRKFEDTRWLLYYNVFSNKPNDPYVIGKGIIEFLPFSKVRYKSLNRELEGYYELYKYNEYFLLFYLKEKNQEYGERKFLINCQHGTSKIMLGQYTSIESMTCNNIVLEKTQESYEEFTPSHMDQESEEYSALHPNLKKYCREQISKGLITPTGVMEYHYL